MSTNIRPEISKKNKWWIPKHRYYELKHFCLQYPEWKEQVKIEIEKGEGGGDPRWSDPVGKTASAREKCLNKIRMVEECSLAASEEIGKYILKSVTEGCSYVQLKMIYNIPCGKDMFYDRYRKFFYVLSVRR